MIHQKVIILLTIFISKHMKGRLLFFAGLLVIATGVFGQKINKNDLTKLTANLNTRWDEQNPILSPDGKSLFFS